MKKIFSIIALVALTFAGCSKADVDTITATMEGTRTVSITLVGADDTATRTTLSNDSSLTWCEGDQIAYFIDKGTRQVATVNADGTFNISLDAEAHTVRVNYPVVTDPAYNNAQYYTYPNALSTTQTQPTLGVFEGKNLPFLGSVAVAAGEEPTSVKATYAIKSGAVMSFLIKCDNTQYLTETLTSLVLTADGKPTYTVILPNDKTIADAVGKKIYCVIEKGTYSNLLVTLNTTTASYRCSTDLATKNGGTIATGDHDSFSLKIDKSETVHRASAGLSIKVGTGELTDWNGTTEGAQAAGLTSGALLGTDAEPVVVKIVTGGVTTMTNA
ncbi:MAG: hypothetical protein SOZ00_05715 [Tidjanibacter sp.]|nr:hypothetical protein [Tidjanibacter sp.]